MLQVNVLSFHVNFRCKRHARSVQSASKRDLHSTLSRGGLGTRQHDRQVDERVGARGFANTHHCNQTSRRRAALLVAEGQGSGSRQRERCRVGGLFRGTEEPEAPLDSVRVRRPPSPGDAVRSSPHLHRHVWSPVMRGLSAKTAVKLLAGARWILSANGRRWMAPIQLGKVLLDCYRYGEPSRLEGGLFPAPAKRARVRNWTWTAVEIGHATLGRFPRAPATSDCVCGPSHPTSCLQTSARGARRYWML